MRQVLDRNFKLGNTILPITLLLLQYCPSPQRYASDYQPPNYTLWYLEPHTRLSWLRSLLVILYKVGRGVITMLLQDMRTTFCSVTFLKRNGAYHLYRLLS